jgi:hypothetical protein
LIERRGAEIGSRADEPAKCEERTASASAGSESPEADGLDMTQVNGRVAGPFLIWIKVRPIGLMENFSD